MYQISYLWDLTPTTKRRELQQKLDVSRQTLWRYIHDPMTMTLSTATVLADFWELDSPRDLVKPYLKSKKV